jgi:hypothetical protein
VCRDHDGRAFVGPAGEVGAGRVGIGAFAQCLLDRIGESAVERDEGGESDAAPLATDLGPFVGCPCRFDSHVGCPGRLQDGA